MNKRKCMLTVDVEALPIRAAAEHVNTLIYGRIGGREYGIGRMMDIADKHKVKMTFFVDFAECELYGDEILQVGRYILSRGHDMQVHCHCDLLEKKVGKPAWVSVAENYYSWYKNDADAKIIVDYVTDKYVECTGKNPLAYRGGEYRFDTSMLKALRKRGYRVDSSYNYVRPEILPINRQFKYENGLIELPLGILPNKKPLNFNYRTLMPETHEDFDMVITEYKKMFETWYAYYGDDAIAAILMHSWSFLFDAKQFKLTKHINTPNDTLVEFFDYFLENFKQEIKFTSVVEVAAQIEPEKLKMVDFQTVFSEKLIMKKNTLLKIHDFIRKKAGKRPIVIWGKGVEEALAFMTVNFHKELNTAYYISKDADKCPTWRDKPVYQYSEVTLSPDKVFVFVMAQPKHTDIRETLQSLGFKEFEDYYDIQKEVPVTKPNGIKIKVQHTCPICSGHEFETYNSDKPRRCSSCGSVERTRTIPKLLNENISLDFSQAKILHVSPTRPERMFFKNKGANVTTLDIRPECKVDIVADICNMPQVESESYDVVFANCVLNHVYDDEKALNEINRVLRPGGIALLWVLDSGSLKTIVHKDPTGWYGRENYEKYRIGTFRHYGEVDFTRQLEKHFADVRCYEKYDVVTDSSCKWYRCVKAEGFSQCISLGWYCGAATALSKVGLRSFSGPFDWYLSPDFSSILKTMEDNFSDFLQIENLQVQEENHKIFEDKKYHFTYKHDIDEDFYAEYKDIRKKYERRAKRFIEAIKKPTCFFRMVHSREEIDYIEHNQQYIEKVIKKGNCNSIIVYLLPGGLEFSPQFKQLYFTMHIDRYPPDYFDMMHLIENSDAISNFCKGLLSTDTIRKNKERDEASLYAYDKVYKVSAIIMHLVCVNPEEVGKTLVEVCGGKERKKEFYLFGAGSYGRKLIKLLCSQNIPIKGIIDNASDKQNKFIDGIPIIPYEAAEESASIFIAVGAPSSVEKIKQQISTKGEYRLDSTYTFLDLYQALTRQ